MAKKKKKIEVEHTAKVINNIGEYGKRVSRRKYESGIPNDSSRGSGKPASHQINNNTAQAQTLPHTQTRLRRLDEYEGMAEKILYGAANANFIGDAIGSGEDFAEEYKRYKRGEFFSNPKSKVFEI